LRLALKTAYVAALVGLGLGLLEGILLALQNAGVTGWDTLWHVRFIVFAATLYATALLIVGIVASLPWMLVGLFKRSPVHPVLPVSLFAAGLPAIVLSVLIGLILLRTGIVTQGIAGNTRMLALALLLVAALYVVFLALMWFAFRRRYRNALGRHLLESHRRKAGVVLVILILGGLNLFWVSRSLQHGNVAGTDSPNVVLFSPCSVRADHFGYAGYQIDTQEIDELVESGVLFTSAITQWPSTPGSYAAMLTSMYPKALNVQSAEHELVRRGLVVPIPDEAMTLAEAMHSHGYRTAGFIENNLAGTRWGFDQGFDYYVEEWKWGSVWAQGKLSKQPLFSWFNWTLPVQVARRVRDQSTTETALSWLARDQRTPFFLFIQVITSHYPYNGCQEHYLKRYAPDYKGSLTGTAAELTALRTQEISITPDDIAFITAQYDACISELSDQVGAVVEGLKDAGLLENTIIVFAADHGENMAEHEHITWFNHGYMYDSVVRIPFAISFPPQLPQGRRIETQVREIDIMPTILDLVGAPIPETSQGMSLVPLISGAKDIDTPEFAIVQKGFGEAEYAVRTSEWKLIEYPDGALRLYNHKSDPGETIDVAQSNPEILAQMTSTLEEWESNLPRLPSRDEPAVDEDALRRLRALGYIE
jgi:arylsulfatase